jgi:vacuolar iron transporter family protein
MVLSLLKNVALHGRSTAPPERLPRTVANRERESSADTAIESRQDIESLLPKGHTREESGHARRQRIDPRTISDATIGLADGLTVPFALTAGLSALGSTKVVIYGGLAELIAGAISMGLGGYLGAKSEE